MSSSNASKGAINPIDLDASLDDIDDLPGFVSFPTGAYIVVLEKGIESKKINEHPALEAAMTLKEVSELLAENLEEDEDLPKPGDIATQSFMLDNEYGAGNFKAFAKPIKEATGATSIREVMEASKGMELIVVIKRRMGKKGTDQEDKKFMSITKVAVL